MPTYEYRCTACDNQWEELQKISEPAIDTCPKCAQKTAKRQISGGNFILKGGGWYADLYSSSPKKANGDSKESSKGGESKSETAAAKTEPAAPKAETKAPSTAPAASGGGDKK